MTKNYEARALKQALQGTTSVKFKAPDGKSNLKFLDKLCRGGIIERFTKAKLAEEYAFRLSQEIAFWAAHEESLNRLLIIWDCLYWARQQHINIQVSCSALNTSLTAYLLEMVSVDPLIQKVDFDIISEEQLGEAKIIVASHADYLRMEEFAGSRYKAGFRPLIEIAN